MNGHDLAAHDLTSAFGNAISFLLSLNHYHQHSNNLLIGQQDGVCTCDDPESGKIDTFLLLLLLLLAPCHCHLLTHTVQLNTTTPAGPLPNHQCRNSGATSWHQTMLGRRNPRRDTFFPPQKLRFFQQPVLSNSFADPLLDSFKCSQPAPSLSANWFCWPL